MYKWILMAMIMGAAPAAALAADAEAGKTVFHKCQACHQLGKNVVSPVSKTILIAPT